MTTKQIPVAFPPVKDEELHAIHARIADILNNHTSAVQNLSGQIAELQKQVKELQK